MLASHFRFWRTTAFALVLGVLPGIASAQIALRITPSYDGHGYIAYRFGEKPQAGSDVLADYTGEALGTADCAFSVDGIDQVITRNAGSGVCVVRKAFSDGDDLTVTARVEYLAGANTTPARAGVFIVDTGTTFAGDYAYQVQRPPYQSGPLVKKGPMGGSQTTTLGADNAFPSWVRATYDAETDTLRAFQSENGTDWDEISNAPVIGQAFASGGKFGCFAHSDSAVTSSTWKLVSCTATVGDIGDPALYSDDFNRADSVNALGGDWVDGRGVGLGVIGNAAYTASGNTASLFNAELADNQYARAVFAETGTTGSGRSADLLVRCAGADATLDCYMGQFRSGNDTWSIFRIDNNVPTSLASGSTAYADNDVIRTTAFDTSICVIKNDVTLGCATDATYSSGKPGVSLFGSEIRIDDFVAADLSAPPPGAPTVPGTRPWDNFGDGPVWASGIGEANTTGAVGQWRTFMGATPTAPKYPDIMTVFWGVSSPCNATWAVFAASPTNSTCRSKFANALDPANLPLISAGLGRPIIISTPMMPDSHSNKNNARPQSWDQFANGDFDSYWTAWANGLKTLNENAGRSSTGADLIIRLAWEHNGDWYGWSVGTKPTQFKQSWIRVVNLVRAVMPDIKFAFSIGGMHTGYGAGRVFPATDFGFGAGAGNGCNLECQYPGDAYVDYLEFSMHDKSIESSAEFSDMFITPVGPKDGFAANKRFGLAAFRASAVAHGKWVGLSEWGIFAVTSGTHEYSTNPELFVWNAYKWMYDNQDVVAYDTWFIPSFGAPHASQGASGANNCMPTGPCVATNRACSPVGRLVKRLWGNTNEPPGSAPAPGVSSTLPPWICN